MKRNYKRAILIVLDCAILSFSLLMSFYFIKEYDEQLQQSRYFLSLISLLVSFLSVSFFTKIYSVINRFTDDKVSFRILVTTTFAYFFTFVVNQLKFDSVNRRLLFLGFVFSTILIIGSRFSWRLLYEYSSSKSSIKSKKVLVVGAGQGAEIFIKTVTKDSSDLDIVGLVDSDLNKKNTYLLGKKVLGTRFDIPKIVQDFQIEEVIIAIPSLSGEAREQIVDICNSIPIPVFNMPSVEDMILGRASSKQLREIDVVDLLGRDEVELDQSQLSEYFSGKTILVTGAGGSIGSEICRQVSKLTPQKLLLVGHGENSIYLIHRELTNLYDKSIEIIPIIADIQDRPLIFELMAQYKPDVVYHAAAHKHVPLMEYNPKEAVKNNIFGTKNVAEAAKAAGVPKFVMVSTDKAVNPPNVMGATKRVAEMIVTGLNEEGKTQFAAVRFGNVLGSRGSVVPVFKDQVAKGGPVTVTDFRMTRYFMTIPEASRLVIQAGFLAKGGEIFVLDMGEPVLIKDLAEKVIKLSGYTTKQIPIVESGIRPGEKLYEELLSTEERVSKQVYEKIFVGRVTTKSPEEVLNYISRLSDMTESELKKSLIEFARQE
ncbi:polysaccharide biosynthesis protein [Streptococcus caprae]|uniref:Polysaccharide biosynthesis protein n=1 Tax=Streptococcus caprae TaxID=1640501 RepID=A0ABV8CTF3_9STRE